MNTHIFLIRGILITAFLAISSSFSFADNSDPACTGTSCVNSTTGAHTQTNTPVRVTALDSNSTSVCQQFSANKDYFIPTRTGLEWSSFLNWAANPNHGVTVTPCSVNCVGNWSSCSNGSQTYAITTQAQNGGTACPYANGATQSCGTPCLGSWSSCSASCGNGTMTFNVTQAPAGGGTQCPSSPVACVGSGSYDSCGTCNGSVHTVTCNTSTAKDTCGNPCVVNGGWGPWTGWTACPGGCAPYKNPASLPTQTNQRLCNSPTPANGGLGCPLTAGGYGLSETKTQTCSVPAPGSSVVNISGGSVTETWTCGNTACYTINGTSCNFLGCPGSPAYDSYTWQQNSNCQCTYGQSGGQCNPPPAPINGGWSGWSQCSQSCGTGTQTRTCSNPFPANGGSGCSGMGWQYCNTQSCPVNCVGSWGGCSNGVQTYSITTYASNGGSGCPYNNGATQACGNNGYWSAWSACSNPYCGGTQTRTCTPPSNGGAPCSGSSTQACAGSQYNTGFYLTQHSGNICVYQDWYCGSPNYSSGSGCSYTGCNSYGVCQQNQCRTDINGTCP